MEQTKIKSELYDHPAMDFELLRKEGVQYLQKLAGGVWTDHNLHDPGITILEQLVYAMTDLSYRIDYSIPDLLAEQQGTIGNDIFTPKQMLPCNPVTLIDWRKLLVDIDGVENAWISKKDVTIPPSGDDYVDEEEVRYVSYNSNEHKYFYSPTGNHTPIDLKGIYTVYIQPEDDILESLNETNLKKTIEQKLLQHKNLCEGFEVVFLQQQTIQLGAEVIIGEVEDTAQLLADVFYEIKRSINPQLTFHSYDELKNKGMEIDTIMEGPLLCHGFLLDEELDRFVKRDKLHMSDIINAIMDVEGVKTVENIHFGNGKYNWNAEIDPRLFPLFNPVCSTLTIKCNNITIKVDTDKALMLYEQKVEATKTKVPRNCNSTIINQEGDHRDIAEYYSVQNQFPVVYGIGETGLFPDVPEIRKAQSKQLSAYLVLFEQILANYFSQIAHVKDLFSFTSEENDTYFLQSLQNAIPRVKELLDQDYLQRPVASVKDPNEELQRKNRFLNHLLARFGEVFTDYSFLLCQLSNEEREALNLKLKVLKEKGFTDIPESIEKLLLEKKTKLQTKLIQDKKRYLQNLPALSANRGKASDANTPASEWGFKERLEHLFGIQPGDAEKLFVVDHFQLKPKPGCMKKEDEKNPYLEVEFETKLSEAEIDIYSFQVSLILNKEGRLSRYSYRQEVERIAQNEVPAHIRLNIIWCDKREFKSITRKHNEWQTLKAKSTEQDCQQEFRAGNQLLVLLLRSRFQLPEFKFNLDKNSFELDMKRYLKTNLSRIESEDLTIEFWFKGISHEGIIRIGEDDSYLTLAANNEHLFKSGNQLIRLAITQEFQKLNDNTWHHIAVVFKTLEDKRICESYFDGTKVDEQPVSSTFKFSELRGDFYMGTYNSVSAYTKGKIAEVRIWKKALEEETIKENHQLFINYSDAQSTDKPYVYWRFTKQYNQIGNIYTSVTDKTIEAEWIDELEEANKRKANAN